MGLVRIWDTFAIVRILVTVIRGMALKISRARETSSYGDPQLDPIAREIALAALPGGADCVEPCIAEMQRSERMGELSLNQLIGASSDTRITEKSFASICDAYVHVDECLASCERQSDTSARIRQTYAGIRFICIEHRKEFFKSLPCLAEHEKVALQQCRSQINASLDASNTFSVTVLKKEQHNLRNHFETLCRRLGEMIDCVEPVTRIACGEQAAMMMLRFITVGFSSFEELYSQKAHAHISYTSSWKYRICMAKSTNHDFTYYANFTEI
ncbi:hypothetical protein WR25_10266 [Diploscapter pachys]|uniref:Chondroitin proteoglycan 4 domain-containing protein n=1 Tax=Diploscapter pachys TaxID=2018661 RepID=A0A2A2LFH1_9BILA|nr:hypothetical protein WR25_10266 [Diploscapter pachys]